MQQQWTSITRSDDLTPYLPLLAFHVDSAISLSSSASSALSNPSTIALLKHTSAYPQLKDINHISNLNLDQLWTSAQSSLNPPPPAPPPPPPPPPAFDALPPVERLTAVLSELHRLHVEHQQTPDAPLSSALFSPPYHPHLSLVLSLCVQRCVGFLPLSSLTSLLLHVTPPCLDVLAALVRNIPDRFPLLDRAVAIAGAQWKRWLSTSPTSPLSDWPLLSSIAHLLHILSSLSPTVACELREMWLAMTNSAFESSHRLSSRASPRFPTPFAYIADLPLSLTVYFSKDVISLLSAIFFPTTKQHSRPPAAPSRKEVDPLEASAGRLLYLYLTEHPTLVRAKGEGGKEGKGEGKDKPHLPPASTSGAASPGPVRAVQEVVEDVKSTAALGPGPPTAVRLSLTSPSRTLSVPSTPPPSTSTVALATLPAPPTATPQSIALVRRHLSKQLHSLILQRKAAFAPPTPSPSPFPSPSSSFPAAPPNPPSIAENSAQCIALVRLFCALCGCSGWQLDVSDATNVLLLVSPLSTDEWGYMDDGGELSRQVLCFIPLCRPPITKLTPAWAMPLQTIRRFYLAPSNSSPPLPPCPPSPAPAPPHLLPHPLHRPPPPPHPQRSRRCGHRPPPFRRLHRPRPPRRLPGPTRVQRPPTQSHGPVG